MNHSESSDLAKLVTAHLEGRTPDVPDRQRAEFDEAVAAHTILQEFINDTIIDASKTLDERRPPDLPDEYEIEREIGKGGMGVVYLAHQRSLNRDVALKVLRPGEQTFGPLVQRFLGEAQHLARLRHPNIVSIHEIGDAQGEPYFTMDFIDGEPLSAVVQRGPMSPAQALSIFKQVAEGVQHAHRQGIIHRDLKPGNVLLDREGTAFVTDFGLARDVSQSSNLTQTGELLGTPQYMAPEQARGQSSLIGEATDIHALGLLLFEMLIGRAAFASSSPADVLVRLLNEDPPPLRSLDRRIPRDLETMCQKMLQKSPAGRYTSVSALLEDVRRFEAGEQLVARRTNVVTRIARWSKRHWKIASAVTGTAAFMLIVALVTGPQFFDKSSEDLIAWGKELHTLGNHEEALHVYRRALEKTDGAQRDQVLNLMIRCCGQIDDPAGFVAAAMPLLKEAPDASFGQYDYLAAQALYAKIIAERPNLVSSSVGPSKEDDAPLKLAARRYDIFLNGVLGSQKERETATQRRHEIRSFINEKSPRQPDIASPSSIAKSATTQLPEGTHEQLLGIADDETVSHWQRGKAAYAAGLMLEKSGDPERARQAFVDGFESMRVAFPTYKGISTITRSSKTGSVEHVETAECGLLRDAFAAHQRLDPDAPDRLRGGLRFRIEGVKLPARLTIKLRVELHDLSTAASDVTKQPLPRIVPINNQTAFLGVADGRYRVSIRMAGTSSRGAAASRVSSLLALDFSDVLKEVEINGNTLDMVIRNSVAEEITLLEPASDETADLTTNIFRWSMIEGAEYYRLMIVKKDSRVGEGRYYTGGAAIRVTSNNICLSTLPETEQTKAAWLTAGTTATWNVSAYDTQGHQIGASLDGDRTFLVGRGLAASK